MQGVIRVLIVDDSAFVRKVVREMLSQSPFIDVIGTARNGLEALEMVESLKPDVVTSDLVMPELDGVGFVREQMSRDPLPIIVMSSLSEDGDEALSALEAGAIEFVQKPTALATDKIREVRALLLEAIKAAVTSKPERLMSHPIAEKQYYPDPSRQNQSTAVVLIGISTGGPQALRYLIPQLPASFPIPIAIVMHMPVGYTALYAERLNEIAELKVCEAGGGERLVPGSVLLAPAGKHMKFKRRLDGSVETRLALSPHDKPHRPSVDVMFESAAGVFGRQTLGIVMTGMGTDGKAGSMRVKAGGGTIFAESEQSCIVFGMPGAVVSAGLADRVVHLEDMGSVLMGVI